MTTCPQCLSPMVRRYPCRCRDCDGAATQWQPDWEVTDEAADWERRLGWPPDGRWTESNWPAEQPYLQMYQVPHPASVPFSSRLPQSVNRAGGRCARVSGLCATHADMLRYLLSFLPPNFFCGGFSRMGHVRCRRPDRVGRSGQRLAASIGYLLCNTTRNRGPNLLVRRKVDTRIVHCRKCGTLSCAGRGARLGCQSSGGRRRNRRTVVGGRRRGQKLDGATRRVDCVMTITLPFGADDAVRDSL